MDYGIAGRSALVVGGSKDADIASGQAGRRDVVERGAHATDHSAGAGDGDRLVERVLRADAFKHAVGAHSGQEVHDLRGAVRSALRDDVGGSELGG
jgi:hypothetical protein